MNYQKRYPQSYQIHKDASLVMPGGITRDVVHMTPFPLYMEVGKGPNVWDVDGHKYVDLIMGNGSLILGHSPDMAMEIKKAAQYGTHLGSCSKSTVELSKLIIDMVPSAELVRFTNSGSEATHLAIRLARAHTKRDKYIKFSGNYHGWYDGVAKGSNIGSKTSDSAGIPKRYSENVIVCNPNQIEEIENLDPNEIAAIILEPSGGKVGLTGFSFEFLKYLRNYSDKNECVLIFDEVVTGFRWSVGGAQQKLNIIPDLTVLGKIIGGGLTSGAVCGKEEIMKLLSITDTSIKSRVHHGGTFSGNPLTSLVGLKVIELLKDGEIISSVNSRTTTLRTRLNELWQEKGLPGGVYGEASVFHYVLEPYSELGITNKIKDISIYEGLQKRLIENGVAIRKLTGMLSLAHDEESIDKVVDAFRCSLNFLPDSQVL